IGDSKFPKQLRGSLMQYGEPVAAGFVCQCASKPTLADASWSDEEDVLILAHPFTGGECAQQLAVKAAWMLVIDIFDHATFFLSAGPIASVAPMRDSLSRATADRRASRSVPRS